MASKGCSQSTSQRLVIRFNTSGEDPYCPHRQNPIGQQKFLLRLQSVVVRLNCLQLNQNFHYLYQHLQLILKSSDDCGWVLVSVPLERLYTPYLLRYRSGSLPIHRLAISRLAKWIIIVSETYADSTV